MLCTECKKNQANVHIVTEVNGKRKEEYLCSECAAKLGKLKAFEPENIFAGFFGLSPANKMFSVMSGADVAELARGFFGLLPKDGAEKRAQEAEPDEIALLRGKIAEAVREERYEDAAVIRDRIKQLSAEKEHIDELRAKLKEAVAEERYEDAAKLRDEIKNLEKEKKEEPEKTAEEVK